MCQTSDFLQNFGDVKNEVFEKKIAFLFFLFYVGEIETEKIKKENGKGKKTTYKNSVFKVVIQNVKNQKNGFFAKIA